MVITKTTINKHTHHCKTITFFAPQNLKTFKKLELNEL